MTASKSHIITDYIHKVYYKDEIKELENLKNKVTEIIFFDYKNINLKDFIYLKKITFINIDFYKLIPTFSINILFDFNNIINLNNFPKTVDSLVFHNIKTPNLNLKKLPDHIYSLHLEWLFINDSCFHNLSSTLKILHLEWLNITDNALQYLPESLESLTLIKLNNVTNYGLRYLPINLQSLTLDQMDNITYIGFLKLPEKLKNLVLKNLINITDTSLRYLPENLEELTLYGLENITELSIKNIPTKLKSLKLRLLDNISDNTLNLPQNLIFDIKLCDKINNY